MLGARMECLIMPEEQFVWVHSFKDTGHKDGKGLWQEYKILVVPFTVKRQRADRE